MINLDISILYQIILFLILWVILSRILFKPYLKLLAEREHKTAGAQHDSNDLEREGLRLKNQYEEKIAQAQTAGYAAKEQIIQEGRQQREKILGEAREDAAHMLEQVRSEVAQTLSRERQLAAAEVGPIAAAMVAKVVGRPVQ
jgi:F-type H+-transporting ATPase subunit b